MLSIAEGNPTIKINGMLAARIQQKLVCAADITKGSPNVLYGAASEQVLTIIDTEQILSLIGTGILIAAFGIEAAIIGYVVTSVIGDAADKYLGEGWGDIINGTLGFLAVGLGAVFMRRAALRGRAAEQSAIRENVLRNLEESRARESSNVGKKPPEDLVGYRNEHILNRHRAGAGKPGKTEFPASWSDARIISEVNKIANDPSAPGGVGKWDSPYKTGTIDGIDIGVDFYPPNNPTYAGKVSTAYPTNTTPNP